MSQFSATPAAAARHRMSRGWHLALVVYFAQHIVFTLIMDLQALLHQHYPPMLQSLYTYYVTQWHDPMMRAAVARPHDVTWFRSVILCELFLQLPFFVVALYFLLKDDVFRIRIPMIIYGTHVATTLVPIFGQLMSPTPLPGTPYPQLTPAQQYTLTALYMPYFVFPIAIVAYFSLVDGTSAAPTAAPSEKKRN
ncbi:Transmembrane protein 97 [Sorochytrium milnesiophthora]